MNKPKSIFCLSGNMLKLIALVSMTVDHIGYFLMPTNMTLRIIGRLAFPIFAYMIAEGCRYTRNKARHIITMSIFALVSQIVFSMATKTLYLNIFVTFALSISLIFAYDYLTKKKTPVSFIIFLLVVLSVIFISEGLALILPKSLGYYVDYGTIGILCPFLVYIGFNRPTKLALCALGLIFLSLTGVYIQWFCLLALIPLALYSGKRGKINMKYLFYLYYPLHIGVIYLILVLLRR